MCIRRCGRVEKQGNVRFVSAGEISNARDIPRPRGPAVLVVKITVHCCWIQTGRAAGVRRGQKCGADAADQFQRQAIFLSQSSKSLRRFPTVLFIARAFCMAKSTTQKTPMLALHRRSRTGGPETARAAPLCTRGGRRARRCHRRRCDIREYFAVCFAVIARAARHSYVKSKL